MTVAGLTQTTQDYLKVVFSAQEWTNEPVTTSVLAQRLGLSPSTVSEGVKRLSEQGLFRHAPYGAIELTEAGRRAAVGMIRRHRLIETFLVEQLGYSWDEVHDEAEVLEHAVSDRMIERIDESLGRPARDPHGDPIPAPDGTFPALMANRLSEIAPPARLRVVRVSDVEPEILRYLRAAGVGLDTEFDLVARRDFAGTCTIEVDSVPLELGLPVAAAIWVTESPSSRPVL